MSKNNTLTRSDPRFRREPDNPRQSMEPSDMEPEDARHFIHDLMMGIQNRSQELPDDDFDLSDTLYSGRKQKAEQHFGKDAYQLFSGIQAALREWDESGTNTEELKEKYGGEFVRGVEIGERLAVYQGSDFTFSQGSNADDNNGDSDSRFTFIE